MQKLNIFSALAHHVFIEILAQIKFLKKLKLLGKPEKANLGYGLAKRYLEKN